MVMTPLNLQESPEEEDPSEAFNLTEGSPEEVMETPEEEAEEVEEHFDDISDMFDENALALLAGDVVRRFESDKNSRKEWMDTVSEGLRLLGTKIEETSEPFEGACGAHHPLILESAVKFQAKASMELFNPKGPVKTAILGDPTEEREAQSLRVRQHMNFQVMQEMEEYFDETENLLFYLPIVGSAFKKTYFNEFEGRCVSEFIPVDQFVVSYYATSLRNAQCYTHVIRRSEIDLKKDMISGLYRDIDLHAPSQPTEGEIEEVIGDTMGFSSSSSSEDVYTLLEQYVFLDLPEDPESDPEGIALPYVITVDQGSSKVLSIRRCWDEDDIKKERLDYFTHFKFVPGMGFYGLGFIHLLGNLQMTLTSTMRSLVDAGTFANLQAGFVDKRLRIRNNDGPLSPGQFKEVESGSIPLDQAIKIIPFKEPSATSMQMYQFIENRAQGFADSTEQVLSESTNYGPVGTTIALLEASTRFFSGIHKRLHQAQKNEFEILARLNRYYLDSFKSAETVKEIFGISSADYNENILVVPVSDPNMSSKAQKLAVAQTIYDAFLKNPQVFNPYEVAKFFFDAVGVEEPYIDKILPPPAQPQQLDPLSDIQALREGNPIAAFPGQDHDSHIAIKTAFMQDPQSGASQVFASLIPKLQSNIQDHSIMKFKESLAAQSHMDAQQAQSQVNQQVVNQAAQKIAQNNQKLAQLQAQGPDTAANKLADASLMRASTEARKVDLESKISEYKLALKKLEIDLKQQQEAHRVVKDSQKDSLEHKKLTLDTLKGMQQDVTSVQRKTPKKPKE